MRYTIDQLVAHMRQGPANFGWDAIVAYDRLKANKVLAQQYIERFTQADNVFLRLEGEVPTTEGEIEYVYDYLMDSPRLSFVNSPITQSKALLTLRILGGSQFTIVNEGGRGAAVNKVAEYDALQSIPYTMDINLTLAQGEIDEGGKVILDLKQGSGPMLYFGPTQNQRIKGGAFMLNKIKSMDPAITTFVLNEIQPQTGQFLEVKYFDIKTHMEPGAGRASAENFGEGAILNFIMMEEGRGTYPGNDDDLKFLIPQGDYSSTTLLGQDFFISRIVVESLKAIAAGSAFDYTVHRQDGFVDSIVVTQGVHQGPRIYENSGHFTHIELSGFQLPMAGLENFSVRVGSTNVLFVTWVGQDTVHECKLLWPGSATFLAYVTPAYRFSMAFKFALADEDGELSLRPILGGRFEEVAFTLNEWSETVLHPDSVEDLFNVLERHLIAEFHRCMDIFTTVATRIDAFRLNSLLFKGEHVVRFTRADFPGDLAMFGTLAPTVGVFDIEPIEHIMGAGSSYTFGIKPAQIVDWSVEKIEGYTGPAGLITASGVYTAPTKKQLEDQGLLFLRVRLKAVKAGAVAVAYALVTVVLRAISINPLVTTCTAPRPGDTPQTREFAGGSLAAGALSWAVAGNTGSTIVPSNTVEGGQTYTPRSASVDPEEYFTLDEVVATDSGGTRESSWVLVEHGGLLGEIKIVDAPGLLPGQIKFSLQNSTGTPFPDVTYRVIKGGGEIDPDTGVYTSNAQEAYRFALITAIGVSPMEPYPAAHSYFILPLPVIDLPILLNVLDRSDKYFKAARTLGMDEAMRVAGINQG